MTKLLSSIETSLATKNWYSALAVSLILPDICSSAEGVQKGRKRYIEWFDKYLGKKYQGFLSGRDCYALRCSFLHEGSDSIEEQEIREALHKFVFLPQGSHCNKISNSHLGDPAFDGKNILQLSVDQFCMDLIDATKRWLSDYSGSSTIQDSLSHLLKIHEDGVNIGGVFIQ